MTMWEWTLSVSASMKVWPEANTSMKIMGNNIAFDLIGHAFKVKSAAADTWNNCADALNSRLSDSRNAVMKAANITDQKVIKDIMPLHPMTALVLKNIAEAFASNQRSMFDFIKVRDDSQAFQWFISNYGPDDDYPLLTIDMLWDFFYEKGKRERILIRLENNHTKN